MKKTYAFLALVIAVLPVLLFFSMSRMEQGHTHSCPISMLMGTECIGGDVGTIEHLNHHIAAAQDTAPGVLLSEIVTAVLLLVFFAASSRQPLRETNPLRYALLRRRIAQNISFYVLRKQLKWIAHQRYDDGLPAFLAGASMIMR